MALAVVAIHVQALYNNKTGIIIYPILFEWFIRLAVPFFFITSGWLIHRKISQMSKYEITKYLDKKIISTIKILGLWLLIYLPISIIYYKSCSTTIFHDIAVYTFNLIIKGESYFAWTLWYLYALAISLIAFRITFTKNTYQVIAGIFFFITYLIANNFIQTPEYITIFCEKPLGGGIYMFSGYLLFSIMNKIKSFEIAYSILASIFSIGLYCFELPLWQLFGGIGIFLICLSTNLKSNSTIFLKLRSQSMWIYFSHMYILFMLNFLFVQKGYSLYFVLTISLLCSILLGFLLNILTNKFPKLRILIS